jgi:hypothetical protein
MTFDGPLGKEAFPSLDPGVSNEKLSQEIEQS